MSSSGCFGDVFGWGPISTLRLPTSLRLLRNASPLHVRHIPFREPFNTSQSNFLWSPTRAGEVTPSMLNKQPDFMSGAAELPVPLSMCRFDVLTIAKAII